jgi:methyl-accepting chemotaxis protein
MVVQRWTDEMVDELASSVGEMRDSITELRDSITEVRGSITELRDSITEVRGSITEIRDSVDGLRITTQALLQVAAQNQRRMDQFEQEMQLMKQRQAENDERFNVLLEEVRYLIRGNQGE